MAVVNGAFVGAIDGIVMHTMTRRIICRKPGDVPRFFFNKINMVNFDVLYSL